jgi:hypothetical protein
MATTILSGLVDDQDIEQTQRVPDISNTIAMLDPDVSQFTTMLMKVSSHAAFNQKVQWFEDQLQPRLSAVSGAQTDSDASIEVTASTGQYFRAGDIVRNARTGEAFTVSSVSTDTLTVVRGAGRVTAAAMDDGDQLLIVANAAAQGATLGTRKQTKKVNNYNRTQIVRHPFGFTNTLIASKLYAGNEPANEAKKKSIEHKRAIEYILFWGARGDAESDTATAGQCGGLFEFVQTNVKDAAGTLSKTLLDTYLRDLLQHGTTNKVLFASPVTAQALSGFLRDAWQPATVNAKLWGAKVNAFISGAYGYQIPVIVKRDWNDFSTSSSQYGGWSFLVDMDNVALRPLRNTQFLQNRQANDADEETHEYLTETSFEVKQELTHGLIVGVTG